MLYGLRERQLRQCERARPATILTAMNVIAIRIAQWDPILSQVDNSCPYVVFGCATGGPILMLEQIEVHGIGFCRVCFGFFVLNMRQLW